MSNLFIRNDYKRDLIKYKMSLVNTKTSRRNTLGVKSFNLEQKKIAPINYDSTSKYLAADITDEEFELLFKINPELAVKLLDKRPVVSFREIYGITKEESLDNLDTFLYHGIRGVDCLSKLLNIIKDGKILSGNYIPGYFNYSDNCNLGEYISLTNYESEIFSNFISPNIFLMISPLIPNLRTIYVPFEVWCYIKELDWPLKNLYSYASGEFLAPKEISWSDVRAIGIDRFNMSHCQNIIYDLKELMERENITIPLYDIGMHSII